MNQVEVSLKDEIEQLLSKRDLCERHSYFQLKYFLIGKEPTLQSKMWQCLKEIKTRSDSLNNMELETEELKDKIELLDISVQKILIDKEKFPTNDKVLHDLFNKESEIKIRQLRRQKLSLTNSIADIENRKKSITEECRFFVESFKNMEKIEPLKHFDDLESQKEYWHEKLTQKVNLKMLTQNSIESDLIETIVALPDDVKIKQQTLQTLNLKQNEILLRLSETAKKLESKQKEET